MGNNQIKIFALGGIEEIGKNMYIIESNDEIFIIDSGLKFADQNVLLGVNFVICPFDYLIQNQHKVKGFIVTHAHDDHIGGIPFLLQAVEIGKIYCAPLTAGIINKKISEYKDLKKYEFVIIGDDSVITTSSFKIDFFRVCHSIPDAFGACFMTSEGNIVSTGDFRFDFSIQGDETNIAKIAEIGRRNIDVLLCESTNSERDGFSDSEQYIIEKLDSLISGAKGRVFVSAFSSDLGLIEHVISIAVKCKRKVCLAGRSMVTNVEVSRSKEVGILNVPDNFFFDIKNIASTNDSEVLVILTGSQGEEQAALNQMACRRHP
jgi:ribonuclease J